MNTFLDAHCHLQDPRVGPRLEDWLKRARERSITEFALGGVGPEDWELQRKVSTAHPGTFHLSVGLHPWWVSERTRSEVDEGLRSLRRALQGNEGSSWYAIGETGLDHQDRFSEEARELQEHAFREQIRLSQEFQKPLVLHIVRAHPDALRILGEAGPTGGGMVHSFSADAATAESYRKLGFLPSISAAVITRGSGKAFHHLKETVLKSGLSELLLETDAPDQPPADRKGELNEVTNLWRVAEIIAEWKGCHAEEVLRASTDNFRRQFSNRERGRFPGNDE